MENGFLSRCKGLAFLAAFTGAALVSGCAIDQSSTQSAETNSGTTVTTWARIALDACSRPVEASAALSSPAVAYTQMTLTQLAVYDTVQSLTQHHFQTFFYSPQARGNPNDDAAIATAAYRVLRTRIPGRAAFLDTKYSNFMAGLPADQHTARGVALGEDIAAQYLALRANDHINDNPVWVQPPTGPGVFEPVAPTPPVDYKITFVPPFTLSLADVPSYFPPPPPALTSDLYATNYNETKALGRKTGSTRTDDQTQLALWTGENSFRWDGRNQIELAENNGLDEVGASRFFAMAFTAQSDSFQVGMSAKYHYNHWRPFHAIPRGDTDGNDATVADPSWSPLLNVNHPEYPAGHGFIGGSSMPESIAAFFGTDNVPWTITTVGVVGLTTTSRSYSTLSAAGADIMVARIYAGLHWRNSIEAGYALGTAVTAHALANNFQPIDDGE